MKESEEGSISLAGYHITQALRYLLPLEDGGSFAEQIKPLNSEVKELATKLFDLQILAMISEARKTIERNDVDRFYKLFSLASHFSESIPKASSEKRRPFDTLKDLVRQDAPTTANFYSLIPASCGETVPPGRRWSIFPFEYPAASPSPGSYEIVYYARSDSVQAFSKRARCYFGPVPLKGEGAREPLEDKGSTPKSAHDPSAQATEAAATSTRPPLTEWQSRVLKFFIQIETERGTPPTNEECVKALKIRPPHVIKLHINALVKKGYLTVK